MKLIYYKSSPFGNFGDELNPWLWPKLFPDILSECGPLFIGIGSILTHQHIPQEPKHKIVFGTGARSLSSLPTFGNDWDIRFVRGPLTAQAVGNNCRYITDGAIALRLVTSLPHPQRRRPSLMLHFRNLDAEQYWRAICEIHGYNYISPTSSIDSILHDIMSSTYLLTEAMHGAIIADTFRIPWIHIKINGHAAEGPGVNDFKWTDWTSSMDLTHNPIILPPIWPSSGFFGSCRSSLKAINNAIKLLRINDSRCCLSQDRVFTSRLDAVSNEIYSLKAQIMNCTNVQ